MKAKSLPSTPVGRRRLLRLARLLEADAKSRRGIKFDLDTFGWSDKKTPSVGCGTTACALGLAALSGAFKNQGLTAEFDKNIFSDTIHVRPSIEVDGVQFEEFAAAEQLFSITNDESQFLFSPDYYGTNQTGAKGERFVAKRIRDFVAGRASLPQDE